MSHFCCCFLLLHIQLQLLRLDRERKRGGTRWQFDAAPVDMLSLSNPCCSWICAVWDYTSLLTPFISQSHTLDQMLQTLQALHSLTGVAGVTGL
jgi:hypothetical protein